MPASRPATRGRAKGWPPRFLTKTTAAERKRGDGPYVCDFIEAYGRITKDTIAGPVGAPLVLRTWQRELLGAVYARRADGRRKHRQALIGVARKNGKSALSSGMALYGLTCEADGAEVYSCAADRDQARIVFGVAKRMVELDEELSGLTRLYRDAIEVPSTGSVYRVLSAEAFTKEGLSPTLVLFDEVHAQPNRELWDVMNLGSGARRDPLVLGITTAGARTDSLGGDTVCYGLYQHGRRVASGEVEDPSFFFAWWEPKKGTEADHRKPATWREANPGHGDLIDPEDFAAVLPRTPEAEFRTKRCNQWVVAAESALPHGAWAHCEDRDRVVTIDEPEVLMVDGAWSGDCTAILACSTGQPHITTIDCWERDPADADWRVPIDDVKARIRETCRARNVTVVLLDPFRWQQTYQDLANEGIPVAEYLTSSLPRIIPAWKKFYDAVLDRGVTHDGNPRLARHVENMRLKIDGKGARPVKEHKASKRHIDLGICAVCAFDVATDVGKAPTVLDGALMA